MFFLIIEQKLCVYPDMLSLPFLWSFSANTYLARRLQHYKLHGLLSDIQGGSSALGEYGWRPVVHIRQHVAVLQEDDEFLASKRSGERDQRHSSI